MGSQQSSLLQCRVRYADSDRSHHQPFLSASPLHWYNLKVLAAPNWRTETQRPDSNGRERQSLATACRRTSLAMTGVACLTALPCAAYARRGRRGARYGRQLQLHRCTTLPAGQYYSFPCIERERSRTCRVPTGQYLLCTAFFFALHRGAECTSTSPSNS